MKTCPYCLRVSPDDSAYCCGCGAALQETRICLACRAVCPQGATFCHKCGNSLRGEPRARAGPARPQVSDVWLVGVGLVGTAMVLLGVFLPFFSVLGLGINYLQMTALSKAPWRGFAVLAAAVLGGAGVLVRTAAGTALCALAVLGMAAWDFHLAAKDAGPEVVGLVGPGLVIIILGALALLAAAFLLRRVGEKGRA